MCPPREFRMGSDLLGRPFTDGVRLSAPRASEVPR